MACTSCHHCSHETQCVIVCALYLGVVSTPFYAIPIYSSTIYNFFHSLVMVIAKGGLLTCLASSPVIKVAECRDRVMVSFKWNGLYRED